MGSFPVKPEKNECLIIRVFWNYVRRNLCERHHDETNKARRTFYNNQSSRWIDLELGYVYANKTDFFNDEKSYQ